MDDGCKGGRGTDEDALRNAVVLEQYKYYRSLMTEAQKQRDDATRFAIITNGALSAWILSTKGLHWLVYFLPLLVTSALFTYWWFGLRRKVLDYGSVIAKLERPAGLDESSGAELGKMDPPSKYFWKVREAPIWISLFAFAVIFIPVGSWSTSNVQDQPLCPKPKLVTTPAL